MGRYLTLLAYLVATCLLTVSCGKEEMQLGAIFDEEAHSKVPLKADALTRDYAVLPRSYSLERYCPTPKNQGQYGTCVSWALSYYALTISQAVKHGWEEHDIIDDNSLSPIFVYQQIKGPFDMFCKGGALIETGLEVIKQKGAPKFSQLPNKCINSIPEELWGDAYLNRIDDYYGLFSPYSSGDEKVQKVKMALSQKRPVVIGFKVYSSFSNVKKVWNGRKGFCRGGHAMCVIGYDDDLEGGAFRIVNSWGKRWGDKGFAWVKYNDFADCAMYGYEIYNKRPSYYDKTPKPLTGKISVQLESGQNMLVHYTPSNGIGHYVASGSYKSGTRYRLYLSNKQPAYVYVFGTDLTGEVFRLFPMDDRTSPALVYASNNLALPSEDLFIEMDDTIGKDYLCILYSAAALDIKSIMRQVDGMGSGICGALRSAVESEGYSIAKAKFNGSSIQFSSSSDSSVVLLVVEIGHR